MRVVAPCNTPRRVVAAALNEIRQACVGMPAVQIRMLDIVRRVAAVSPPSEIVDELRAQADAVLESLDFSPIARRDRADVMAAHERAVSAMAAD